MKDKILNKGILIQARLSSSRYPGKMLDKVGDVTLLEYVFNRCSASRLADKVIVITSKNISDDAICDLCSDKGIPFFRGELDNVLKRYVDAANYNEIDVVSRVCGDSPFVDVEAVDQMFSLFSGGVMYDYVSVSNAINGFISEVFLLEVLEKVMEEKLTDDDKEHVTRYIVNNKKKFRTKSLDLGLNPKEMTAYTLTVDYPRDIVVANRVAEQLNGFCYSSIDVVNALTNVKLS